jgi:citrate lyase beta subunit
VDIDGVANQTEWHYHKLGTAVVELAGKLWDKDHISDARFINKGMDYSM